MREWLRIATGARADEGLVAGTVVDEAAKERKQRFMAELEDMSDNQRERALALVVRHVLELGHEPLLALLGGLVDDGAGDEALVGAGARGDAQPLAHAPVVAARAWAAKGCEIPKLQRLLSRSFSARFG